MPYISVEQAGYVPEHHVPLQDRHARDEALIERQQRLLIKNRELTGLLENLEIGYRRDIRALVGEESYDANVDRQRDLQKRFAQLRDSFPVTPEGERARQEQRRRLLQEKHDLYHGLGIDIDRGVAIRKAHLNGVKTTAAGHIDLDLEMTPRPEGEPPAPTNNPWTWYTAPYAHQWASIQFSAGSAGSIWRSANAWASTGEVNLASWIELFGAGDSDWSKADAMCEVGFWFRMPAAGILEVWAWFQDINTDYSVYLEDESGCSDAYVHQLSRLYLWTAGSTERYLTVLDKKRGEEDEGSWSDSLTKPGAIQAKLFHSQKTYAAGEWVYGAVGVRDFNLFQVDDMSCRSRMYSQYFLKQLAVRSTGAP